MSTADFDSGRLADQRIAKGALVAGVMNGAINGVIQFFLLRHPASIPLSVNDITNDVQTIFGTAVPLAVSLAMILTIAGYLTLKGPKRSFWPDVLWVTVKHGVFAFGAIVSGAFLWQRVMGSVSLSVVGAVIVLSLIAAVVAAVVNYMTIKVSTLYLHQRPLAPTFS